MRSMGIFWTSIGSRSLLRRVRRRQCPSVRGFCVHADEEFSEELRNRLLSTK